MGIYEFTILSEQNQYDLVFTKGQFVDTVTRGQIKYALYALPNSLFWVEVTYSSTTNKIIKCSPFISGDALNKYSNIPKKL